MNTTDKFIIKSRYEYWSINGIKFCDWYILDSTPKNLIDTKAQIDELYKQSKLITKKTKLKHEFIEYSYDQFIKDKNKLEKDVKLISLQNKKYYESDEYKELQRKKRESLKELKNHQQKYHERYGNN